MLNGRVGRALRRGALVLGVVLATGATAAACGGTPSGSGVANLNASTTTAPASHPGTSTSEGGGTQGGTDEGSNRPGGHSEIGMAGVSVALSQCMRANGVPSFPDPNSQGAVTLNGVDPQSASFQKAQKACAKYEPNGGKPPSAAQQQALVAQALAYSKCMRTHGVPSFPDPQISDNNGHVGIRMSIRAGSGLDPNSQTFQKAQEKCQALSPGRLPDGAPAPK